MLTRVKRIVRNDEAKARDMVALYRKTHAGISNTDVWLIMNADNTRRANAQLLDELKTAQGKAPSYLYYFTWRSPVHKGQMKSYHTLDIPFALYNIDHAASMTGADAGSLRAGAQDERGVRVVRAHRQSESRGSSELAGVQHPRVSDDDVRERVQGGERSESRGAARVEGDSRARQHNDHRAVTP